MEILYTKTASPKWFVLFTRPNFEKKIAGEISRFNHEYYLPLKTNLRKWSDRVKRIEEPLFSRYIFVRIDPKKKHDVLHIAGVIRMLSNDGIPTPIDPLEIEKIRIIEASGSLVNAENYYVTGERVQVVNGPFAGIRGYLVRKTNASRLVIKITLLKQAISVDIPANDVRKDPGSIRI